MLKPGKCPQWTAVSEGKIHLSHWTWPNTCDQFTRIHIYPDGYFKNILVKFILCCNTIYKIFFFLFSRGRSRSACHCLKSCSWRHWLCNFDYNISLKVKVSRWLTKLAVSVEDSHTKPVKDPISGAIAQAGQRQGTAPDLLLEGAPESMARAWHWNSKRALMADQSPGMGCKKRKLN